VLQFNITTFQCGIVTLIPAESTSQVALSLLVTLAMLVTLANARPYLNWRDDVLAQTCQFSLALVQIVGLLQMNECVSQDDWLYGPILILSTGISGGFGIVLIAMEFFQAVAPRAFDRFSAKLQSAKKGAKSSRKTLFKGATISVFPSDLQAEENGSPPTPVTNSPREARPNDSESSASVVSQSQLVTGPPSNEMIAVVGTSTEIPPRNVATKERPKIRKMSSVLGRPGALL
jgi:hypothetical protein